MLRIRYPCQILMKLGFSRHIFEKLSNIKCHKYRPDLFHVNIQTDRQTEKHGEANSHFSQFCEEA